MTLDPYKHEHENVEEIPWSRLGNLLIQLAEMIWKDWQPEVVVGIAKGGVIPGVFLSSAYRADFFPIKLSSRHNEEIVSQEPVWYVYPTDQVRGKKVLLVDDICVAGRTLKIATEEIKKLGAKEIMTATLAVHHGSVYPDYYILETDGLIVWPWDRDIIIGEGMWMINPEYLEVMKKVQGYEPGASPAREYDGYLVK